jgi:PAS domain S-box-containing protein
MINYLKNKIKTVKLFFVKIIDRDDIDLEEKGRRKLFVVFLLIIVFPLAAYGVFHIKNGLPQYGIPNLLICVLIFFIIFFLRYMEKGKNVFRLIIFIEWVMLVYWIYTGAIQGLASLIIFPFPLLAYFLIGRKEGTFWSISLAAVCLLIFFNPFPHLAEYQYTLPFIVRYITSLFIVILFTYSYEAEREKYRDEIQSAHKNLIRERNNIAIAKEETDRANMLLKNEMNEKRKYQIELQNHKSNLEGIVADRTNELKQKNNELLNALDDLKSINTELQLSRSDLEISEIHYRILANNVVDLIWSMDMSLKFIYMSPSVKTMYGYTVEEAMNIPLEKWSTPDSTEKIKKIFLEQIKIDNPNDPDRSVVVNLEQYRKDGSVLPVECKVSFMRDNNMKPIGVVGITRDISERVESQKEKEYIQSQLAHAQKMEAMGTLVGGLAHDFNNFLGGIIGSLDLLKLSFEKEDLKYRDDVQDYLKVAMDSATRSSNIIKQLLTISKKKKLELAPVDINLSLLHVLTICKTSFPKNITLDFNISSEKLIVLAEAGQIEQVLLNLCINASHAMTIMRQDKSFMGGILSVTLSKVRTDESLIKINPEAEEFNDWICMQIKDTGVGIEENIINRIFEPFYTTKSHDDGTGLGLSISYSIVKQHNGFIHVTSTPGETTTFSVYLPEFESSEEVKTSKVKERVIINGTGTILIIDDEKIIIDVVTGILSRSGYNVISAMAPEEGILMYKEKFNDISAVILDLSMPQMSGIEVYKELKSINRDIRAVLSSGMLDNETRSDALKLGINDVLYKPFNAVELTEVISRILI